MKDHTLDGYLVETPAAAGGVRPGFEWVTKAKADIMTRSTIASAVRTTLTRESLAKSGMTRVDVDQMLKPVELTDAGGEKSGGLAAYSSVFAIFLLMYFAILFYGMNVARSIIEEKTSRVFEVMLATIKPEEMMAGKVLGVGAVGLTQVGIWIAAGALVLKSGMLMAGFSFPITALQVMFFVLFFVLGFALYSALAAALGRNEQQRAGAAANADAGDAAVDFVLAGPAEGDYGSEWAVGHGVLVFPVLHAADHVCADCGEPAAGVADRLVDCGPPADDRVCALVCEQDLSRGHPDVRQEAEPAGDFALGSV